MRNSGARAGDALILTKPLGVGVLSAALKQGRLDEAGHQTLIATTTALNRIGPALAAMDGVHAITDVTGFGLLGHALEMARGAGLTVEVDSEPPLLAGVEALARAGVRTGASERNWASYGGDVEGAEAVERWRRDLLCDPQTSGGLLIAVRADEASPVLTLARREGFPRAEIVGRFVHGPPIGPARCWSAGLHAVRNEEPARKPALRLRQHVEVFEAAEEGEGAPDGRRVGLGEAQVREAVEQARQGDLGLQAGERRADADVGAAAEGDVRALAPVMSKRCGSSNTAGSRLAPRRETTIDWVAWTGQPPTSISREATRPVMSTGGSKRSTSSTAAPIRRRVGAQLGEFAGVQEEEAHAIADQVGGGQVAADQQADEVGDQLAVGESAPVGLQRRHVADEIVGGTGAALLQERGHVAAERFGGALHVRGLLGRAQGIERLDEAFGPVAELGEARRGRRRGWRR